MIEKSTHLEPSRPLASVNPSANGSHDVFRGWRSMGLVAVGAISVIVILSLMPNWIQKWLWMRQFGYTGVFWTLLSLRCGLFCAAFVVALLYFWINLRLAATNGATFRTENVTRQSTVAATLGIQISPTVWKLAVAANRRGTRSDLCTHLLYAMGYVSAFSLWRILWLVRSSLRGRCRVLSFRLPFYELLQSSLSALTPITLVVVSVFYAYFGLLPFSHRGQVDSGSAKAVSHLSALFFGLAASWGWEFYLDHYELLYSTQGVVYGAG